MLKSWFCDFFGGGGGIWICLGGGDRNDGRGKLSGNSTSAFTEACRKRLANATIRRYVVRNFHKDRIENNNSRSCAFPGD